ncbi:hypothetical protein MBRA1_002821 [Malassezia brasiliensis]|uniref:Uncharacterized protein n=1 Tax=Malassezia brasiliensis TaxID=1821822 RepID=A0AAF0IQI8_9BASI|nr:hypothetical protein MBRA1_002821 [Malassezia brasiliensis]
MRSTSSRSGFVPEHFGLSSRATPLGNFAAMRARLPRGPSYVPSMRHGAGLQSARSFSSGPQGARLFETLVTNAPLALRAVGCEVEDQWSHKWTAQRAWSAFAHSLNVQRFGIELDGSLFAPVKRFDGSQAKALDASAATAAAFEDEAENKIVLWQHDLERLFPIAPSKRMRRHVVTTLYVPLEPDIPPWPNGPGWNAADVSGNILDPEVRERLCIIHEAYCAHKRRILRLEWLLREHHLWPTHLNVDALMLEADPSHPLALHIEFDGWTKARVCDLLQRRLGSHDWCTLFEEDYLTEPYDAGASELQCAASDTGLQRGASKPLCT